MKITFVGRNYELKEPTKSLIEKKLGGIRKRYFDRRIDVQVILTAQKYRHRCELNVHSDGFIEVVRSESNDMLQSIDSAIEKLEMMLRKRHDKMVSRKQRIDKRMMAEGSSVAVAASSADFDDPKELPEIVQANRAIAKPISVSEAAWLLLESDDLFVAFRDIETDRVVVLYKRRDGKLGLIRP